MSQKLPMIYGQHVFVLFSFFFVSFIPFQLSQLPGFIVHLVVVVIGANVFNISFLVILHGRLIFTNLFFNNLQTKCIVFDIKIFCTFRQTGHWNQTTTNLLLGFVAVVLLLSFWLRFLLVFSLLLPSPFRLKSVDFS